MQLLKQLRSGGTHVLEPCCDFLGCRFGQGLPEQFWIGNRTVHTMTPTLSQLAPSHVGSQGSIAAGDMPHSNLQSEWRSSTCGNAPATTQRPY